MTYQKFLDFDTNKFYKPGYESEKKYMSFITASAVRCLNNTRYLYDLKVEQNKTKENPEKIVMHPNENVESRWLNFSKPIHEFLKNANVLPPVESLHEDSRDFIVQYEKLLKKYLTSYHKNYADIASDEIKKINYYSANSVDKIFDALTDFKVGITFNKREFAEAGFIDMRLPIVYSFETPESSVFVPNSYSEEMEDHYDSFEKTLSETVAKFGGVSEKRPPREKQ